MADESSPGDRPAEALLPRIFESSAMQPDEITRARQLAVARLVEWGRQDAEDAALVFSELATNAVIHAGGAVRIIVIVADRVRIEVHDNDPTPPWMRAPGSSPGGLGLRIVEQLSERWGSRTTTTGKLVWAELPADHETRLRVTRR